MIISIERWARHGNDKYYSLIGVKKFGSRWEEEYIIGDDDYIEPMIGKTYMSYLKRDDILSWFRSDFPEAEISIIDNEEDLKDILWEHFDINVDDETQLDDRVETAFSYLEDE